MGRRYRPKKYSLHETERYQDDVRHALERYLLSSDLRYAVILQPNAPRSVEGQSLESCLPGIKKEVERALVGKHLEQTGSRGALIQGVTAFEGAVDDHCNMLIRCDLNLEVDQLWFAFDRAFRKRFPDGTIFIIVINPRNRYRVIRYTLKEMWKIERYEQLVIFGPHDEAEMSLQRLDEEHARAPIDVRHRYTDEMKVAVAAARRRAEQNKRLKKLLSRIYSLGEGAVREYQARLDSGIAIGDVRTPQVGTRRPGARKTLPSAKYTEAGSEPPRLVTPSQRPPRRHPVAPRRPSLIGCFRYVLNHPQEAPTTRSFSLHRVIRGPPFFRQG